GRQERKALRGWYSASSSNFKTQFLRVSWHRAFLGAEHGRADALPWSRSGRVGRFHPSGSHGRSSSVWCSRQAPARHGERDSWPAGGEASTALSTRPRNAWSRWVEEPGISSKEPELERSAAFIVPTEPEFSIKFLRSGQATRQLQLTGI